MRGLLLTAATFCICHAADVCTGAPTVGSVGLPGSPFKILVSNDGCTLYASMAGKHPGLAVLKRSASGIKLKRTVDTSGPLTGLALTHDGKTLVATSGKSVYFFDAVKAVLSGQLDEEPADGKVYVNVTADGKIAFVSNERSHSISVIDVEKHKVTARIQVGNAPIALTFSPDGKRLYTTSQSAPPDWAWPAVCDPENPGATARHPRGAILVIDVATTAVISRHEAGCNPVRLALSPDGGRAYVTARKDNSVLVFETAAFARIATVPVGSSPVPVAVINDGQTILVGNSNRFGGGETGESLSVIDAASLRVTGKIAAGAFPRDIVPSPDGLTVYVANFGSNSIGILNPAFIR